MGSSGGGWAAGLVGVAGGAGMMCWCPKSRHGRRTARRSTRGAALEIKWARRVAGVPLGAPEASWRGAEPPRPTPHHGCSQLEGTGKWTAGGLRGGGLRGGRWLAASDHRGGRVRGRGNCLLSQVPSP